jgi:hypothetical protein
LVQLPDQLRECLRSLWSPECEQVNTKSEWSWWIGEQCDHTIFK